ncbi:MAG: hypothetical protein AAF307_11325 [Pseudomonadota bacterium]
MIARLLQLASRQARVCLMLGLAGGVLLPGLAAILVDWLPQMVAVLLTVTALRIGHAAVLGALGDLRWGLAAVVTLQVGLPLTVLALMAAFGLGQTPAALAAVLACAAPAITGSVNLALILRLDAGRMMQLLVLGTALFPLTVLPVLAALPQLGAPADVAVAALRLLGVILGATALGFAIRAVVFPHPSAEQIKSLDGLSVLAFAFIVIGLMAALNPALRQAPGEVALWAALAFVIGYGLQAVTLLSLRRGNLKDMAGVFALGAGNRNIAIFLVALPPEVLAPLMVFIGCWQLPMYLTPVLLPRLYRWALKDE